MSYDRRNKTWGEVLYTLLVIGWTLGAWYGESPHSALVVIAIVILVEVRHPMVLN